ncbi:hypothetical protein J3P85_04075 [Pseudomonas sp. Z1-12]
MHGRSPFHNLLSESPVRDAQGRLIGSDIMTTFKKPVLVGVPDSDAEKVTVSLSKMKTLTVQIPNAENSPESTVHLTVSIPKQVGAEQSMLVEKTPETHPNNFETPELRKDVTLTFSSDELKQFKGKSVELRYTFDYTNGWDPETSAPQILEIKA